jgi:mannose-1-phosphate guanylyltransferase
MRPLVPPDEEKVIEEEYSKIDGISIDFGVMQRTHRAVVLDTSFLWDDIGSFTSLDRFIDKDEDGNIISGCGASLLNVQNTTILGDKRLISAIGVKDMLIVDTDDVVLVCPKDRYQEIKELVKRMSSQDEFERFYVKKCCKFFICSIFLQAALRWLNVFLIC